MRALLMPGLPARSSRRREMSSLRCRLWRGLLVGMSEGRKDVVGFVALVHAMGANGCGLTQAVEGGIAGKAVVAIDAFGHVEVGPGDCHLVAGDALLSTPTLVGIARSVGVCCQMEVLSAFLGAPIVGTRGRAIGIARPFS